MKVHGYASLPHYARHIAPVLAALPDGLRGDMYAPSRKPWGGPPSRGRIDGLLIVAGFADAQTMWRNRLVYVEHGSGQSYRGDPRSRDHPSYSGGISPIFRDRVVLFLCPGPATATRWRAAYPVTPVVAVGCPALDPWHVTSALNGSAGMSHPVVVLAWHWECALIPETRSALNHYVGALDGLHTALDGAGVQLLGHAHPRAHGLAERVWEPRGIPWTASVEDVLDQASLVAADNTSLLYEVASTGRPVVALNAPWYRRHIDHGGRFWSHVPGLQVDRPDQLYATIMRALDDPPEARRLRSAAVQESYSRMCDGHAADRAARAVEEVARAESVRSEDPPLRRATRTRA